jgi:hypothetical protein
LHSIKFTITGRRKSLISSHSSSDKLLAGTFISLISAPLSAPSDGYQLFPLTTPPEDTTFFQWLSVTLLFLSGRHASPEPFIEPSPVIAIFSRFLPEIGDWHLRVSRPSNTVFTRGYKSKSGENKIKAPFSRCKLIFDLKTIGPVNQIPLGTTSVPPPFSERLCIAFSKASVLRVMPSDFPPKSSRFTLYFGKIGISILGISKDRSSYRY